MTEVVELGPTARMTPEDTLALAAREDWSEVMVVGYFRGGPDLVVRSSAMSRRDALWLAEHLKLHALNRG